MSNQIKFVGLHAHSVFSVFDGLGYPQDHIDYAIENGMDALALTDHGNMNGLSYQVLHSKKLQKEGKNFKPIFGIEGYFIDSVAKWKEEKAEIDKNKKGRKKKEENSAVVIEDEEATKRQEKNILNRRAHLVLLVQNQTGLNNLFTLVSKSFDPENFYRYPRIDYDMLREHNEGIIVSSACMGGPLSKDYWNNREEGDEAVQRAMVQTIENFTSIFGDRFYGELQWNAIPEQHEINKHIIKAAERTGIKLISTADSHYPRPELFKDRELYKQLGWLGKSKPDYAESTLPESREELKYELYPKNGDQMWDAYKTYSKQCGVDYDDDFIRETIERTYEIAHSRIESFYPDATVRLPDFVVPNGKSADETLRELCVEGLEQKGLASSTDYSERLKEELGVIQDRGFSKYFLTMKAVSDEATKTQLVGAGRGSAAGSLVAYVLGITGIDPIEYGLLFSRFLRRDAVDYPDIDYDVADPMVLKEILIDKWGKDVVVPISNYNTLQLRSLIKDISKFYGVDFTEVNRVTSVMLKEATPIAKKAHGITAGVYAPTFEEVKEYSETLKQFLRKYPHIATHVDNLYGQVRSISRHAGGVVIADGLNKHMPLINSGGVQQTPWSEGQNVRHLEPLGFIKFDILGLASLRMVEGAISHILRRHHGIKEPSFADIKKWYDENLEPNVLNLNDQKVYKNVFHKGKWAGVFQFTEKGAQGFCKKAKPESIIDISAITSIYRPGPLSAKVHNHYVKAKRNPMSVKYLHPLVKEVTKETYGFLIFQEQIALLAHKLGKDLSLDEGNMLRKLLTKKGTGKGNEKKMAIHKKFIEGCVEKGIKESDAQTLWQTFEYFSGYGFNKSHAVSYSILSYQCAYLLTYYPVEWMAAYLDKELEGRKERAINIVQSLGYRVERPHINESGQVWEIGSDDKSLIQPLTSIKGLGDKAVEQILQHRPFNNVEELLFNDDIVYSKLNKKALDVMARCGAMNCLMDERFTGMKHFWSAVAVDRPKKEKDLIDNIELYKPEGDFSDMEKIEYLTGLTGIFPFSLVLKNDVYDSIKKNKIPALGEYDKAIGVAWFIPREVIEKKTKTGKPYYIVKTIDDTNNQFAIKCWGVNPAMDRVAINRPYLAKLDYNETWGFSSRSISRNWRMIG
jgi:DNA polymerase-3 subunit alpha